MATMCDGSEQIPKDSYVRVVERGPGARTYIGKVVGTDIFSSKYQIGRRYAGWGEWLFLDGGSWAFPGWVTLISEEEALAVLTEP